MNHLETFAARAGLPTPRTMTDEQTKRLMAAAPELLAALRVIAANDSSAAFDPQWPARVALDAIENLRGIPTPDTDGGAA